MYFSCYVGCKGPAERSLRFSELPFPVPSFRRSFPPWSSDGARSRGSCLVWCQRNIYIQGLVLVVRSKIRKYEVSIAQNQGVCHNPTIFKTSRPPELWRKTIIMASRWWSKDTVAVVTGSNKGIGFEIVRGLAKNGVTTVLTARDKGRGQQAADSLKAQGLDSVIFHQLDVNNANSIDALAVWVKDKFGGLDIVVNNAGVYEREVNYHAAKATIDTNYYAVKNVTSKLLPLLRPGARILNISSSLGQLSYLGKSKAKIFGDDRNLSDEVVDSYAEKYLEDVKAGRSIEEGWATGYPQYSESKVLLNAYMRALAKTLSKRPANQKVYVNNVHPGYIGTDLNSHSGPGTPEEGADTAVWLALLPEKDYPQGGFWYERKPLAF